MKRKNGKIFLGIIFAMLILGVGYASMTAIPLIINGSATATATADQNDFNVHFDNFVDGQSYITYSETTSTGDSLIESFVSASQVTAASSETEKAASATINANQNAATVTVSNLTNIGDTVTLKIPVINESDDIKADLSTSITNNNQEYFTVTSTTGVETLNANNATSYVNVVVTVNKVPKVDDVTGTFTVTLTAEPTE